MKKISFCCLILVWSCTVTKQTNTALSSSALVTQGKLFASLFQQRAAEYKALCLQAYNTARISMDLQTAGAPNSKPKAIITDIDETVLDNSAYEVHQTLQGKDYDEQSWIEWTNRAEADTVPGAPYFLKYAASKGVSVFYVTNRTEKERSSTLKNLQKFNLPNADNEHLFPRQTVSSKEDRRKQIFLNYDVILLIGDNLADFSSLFDKKTMAERDENVNSSAGLFGTRFIVLPNSAYGDWESALYKYNYSLTPAQKDSVIRSMVKTY